jgi:hypothetical protein
VKCRPGPENPDGVIRELRSTGYISLRQIAAGLNERKIGAPRGKIERPLPSEAHSEHLRPENPG